MAQAITIIEVDHGDGIAPADVARRLALPTAKPQDEAVALGNFFSSLPRQNAKVRVRVDSITGVAAARTVAITGANIAVDEWIGISTPLGTWKVTCVDSGAASGDGTFDDSAVDATCATNIANAINSLAGLKSVVVASTDSGNLIITAADEGTLGNSYRVVDGTTNGISSAGLLTGGLDITQRVTASIACVLANTDADDTVTIGRTVFTAKSGDASGDNQFNLGASDTAMGDNLVAKINAHPQLLGIVSGVNASGTITLTYACDPRVALHIQLATSDADGLVITQPSSSLTTSNAQATRTYSLGAP